MPKHKKETTEVLETPETTETPEVETEEVLETPKTFPVFAIKENIFIFVSEAEFDKTNHKLV